MHTIDIFVVLGKLPVLEGAMPTPDAPTSKAPLLPEAATSTSEPNINQPNRRRFLGQMGATLAVGALAAPAVAAAQTASSRNGGVDAGALQTAAGSFNLPDNARVQQSFNIRLSAAVAQALVPIPPHHTNGDQQRDHPRAPVCDCGIQMAPPLIPRSCARTRSGW